MKESEAKGYRAQVAIYKCNFFKYRFKAKEGLRSA